MTNIRFSVASIAVLVIAMNTAGQAQRPAPGSAAPAPAGPAARPSRALRVAQVPPPPGAAVPAPPPPLVAPVPPVPPTVDLDALRLSLPDPGTLHALQAEIEALQWSLPEPPLPAPMVFPPFEFPPLEPFPMVFHTIEPGSLPRYVDLDFDGGFTRLDFDYAQAPERVTFASDRMYEQARNAIEQNEYERALQLLDRVISSNSQRADAAMYWKAYSQARVARRADALATVGEMQKKFPNSRWIKDARALDVMIRQASGQAVAADALPDEELRLLALRGLMQSDPEAAIPVVEKILSGTSSARVKEQALFVLSQNRNPKARGIILGVAKGDGNPELQLRAIRYLGMMGGDNLDALDSVYRSTTDEDIRRSILRTFGAARAQTRLLAVAKSEQSETLRGEAVQQLGALRAAAELEDLYRSETSPDVRRRILQGLAQAGAYDRLGAIARTEKDPELRRSAIRGLGAFGGRAGQEGTNLLVSLYGSEQSTDVRRQIIDVLASHRSAKELVDLARAEKDGDLKKAIVSRLSTMREPAARDYMLELLK